MPGDPIEAMEFAQSKGKARKEGQTSVTFGDVAGIDPIVSELQAIVTVGQHPVLNSISPVLNSISPVQYSCAQRRPRRL